MRQTLFQFEQAIVGAKLDAEMAKLKTKLAERTQRAIRKRQAEMDKSTRRLMRDHARKQKQPIKSPCVGSISTPSVPANVIAAATGRTAASAGRRCATSTLTSRPRPQTANASDGERGLRRLGLTPAQTRTRGLHPLDSSSLP